jgi:hypothetical protein
MITSILDYETVHPMGRERTGGTIWPSVPIREIRGLGSEEDRGLRGFHGFLPALLWLIRLNPGHTQSEQVGPNSAKKCFASQFPCNLPKLSGLQTLNFEL